MSVVEEVDRGSAHAREPGAHVDFRFLPKELAERSRQLIESYHDLNGYAKLADLLWHAEDREFISRHRELAPVFRKASVARSAKKAQQGYVLIATILLSLELLASDFAGWGKRFPSAKRKADLILREHLPNSCSWLTDFYLYHWRRTMDQTILETISPPAAARQPPADRIVASDALHGRSTAWVD